jgi:terminal uridylyltransferase
MWKATVQEQQEYLENTNTSAAQANKNSTSRPTQQKNKRPNQAQRRQNSSNLSIPIDNSPSQTSRSPGYGPPPVQSQPQWSNQGYGGQNTQKGYQRQSNGQYHSQPYSPRHNNHGPPTPYSPQKSFSQTNPNSSMPQYQQSRPPHGGNHQSPRNQHFQNDSYSSRPPSQGRQLYQPGLYQGHGHGNNFNHTMEEAARQSSHLENILQQSISVVGIDSDEEAEKEAFRAVVEQACRNAISTYERNDEGNANFDPLSVDLQCFGSMKSGFATKSSDMDLALLSPQSRHLPDSADSPIPRMLEKALLDMGFGARLLTRTRVPIIKLCQYPTQKLKADLLEEREKWENGFPEDTNETEAQTIIVPVDSSPKHDESTLETIVSRPERNSLPPSSPSKMVGSYEEKLASLKQKKSQSLGDYHVSAKRLLRQLGSRDITSAGAPDITEDEARVLNDICKAFFGGLASDILRERLMKYPSVAALFDPDQRCVRRTLQGSWLQVDGERMALNWGSHPLLEENDRREFDSQAIVIEWGTLQQAHPPNSLDECMRFNRELYLANERLKRISSLQLTCLEQIPHEEPFNYFSRVQRLVDTLKGNKRQEMTDDVNAIVVQQYIQGIYNSEIRSALQKLTTDPTSLYLVALQHRVMQLITDYEHALKTGVYKNNDRLVIEQYVAFLKTINTLNQNFNVNSIANGVSPDIISAVRILPDPSATSADKPRDRYKDHLEFPKTDIGIQCDINFSAHLAIHNTLLLRCYSHCDPRVKLMILFVKNWAKLRGINTPYRGSLSSYGYVLMVLHYLVNIAQPFVCPNLQEINRDPPSHLSPAEIEARTTCNGCDVRFWRNEFEIKNLADRKMLNHNHDSVGFLLRGFFEYYAQNGDMTTVKHRGFDWGREVLSLRTRGGILSKQIKGWVGAKTTIETNVVAPPTPSTIKPAASTDETTPQTPKPQPQRLEETKEIRHRYLFAIEDPFELTHNVARTVTHNGIVAIRDEFRRAWRILRNIDKPEQRDGGLLDPIDMTGKGGSEVKGSFLELLEILHGPEPKKGAV